MGKDLIEVALAEDIGSGDVTCQWFIKPGCRAMAQIIAKESTTLAGGDVAIEVFRRVDPELEIIKLQHDGANLHPGEVILQASGSAASILTAERTVLNFVQHLSGIATLTRKYVDAVAGTGVIILDTRKTTPGFRALEKAAVLAGGGMNHRSGLYDMVMIKDNHLATGASLREIQTAITAIKEATPSLRIEIEADSLGQAQAFFQLHDIDVILLDNMLPDVLREAVRLRPPHIKLEASGGVTLDTVRTIAETGVDFISVGALTHSAPAKDFSLELSHHL